MGWDCVTASASVYQGTGVLKSVIVTPVPAAGASAHRLKHHLNRYPVPERVLVSSGASGAPAGVPASLPQEADAAESRVVLLIRTGSCPSAVC